MEPFISNYILFWVCITGLCLGSFYNVVILRSLSNESIIFPPSKCPKCGAKLKIWHNIPIFSYIFLRGKCGFCKEPISIQYPLVELLTMILFAACYLKFGLDIKTLFAAIICSAFIIMSGTDIKEKVADCNIPIALCIIGLIYNFFVLGNIADALIGLAAGVLIIEIIANAGRLLTKSRALGEADTYVAAAIGAYFGLKGLLFILLYSLIASMIFILPMFFYKQYKNNNKAVCILSVLFITLSLVYKTAVQNYFMLALVVLSGTALTILILKSIKNRENLTYLPLIPAFAVGTFYYMFF